MSVESDIETAVAAILDANLAFPVSVRKTIARVENDPDLICIVKCTVVSTGPGMNDTNARIRGIYRLLVFLISSSAKLKSGDETIELAGQNIRRLLFGPTISGTLIDDINPDTPSPADESITVMGVNTVVIPFLVETYEPLTVV